MKNTYRTLMMTSVLALAGIQGMQAADLDVFGGYTVGRMKPDSDASGTTVHGWNASATGWLTRRFGVTADFAGMYRALETAYTTSDTSTDHLYSFMGGPQVRLLHFSRVETSVRAAVGASYGADLTVPNHTADQTVFSALVGSNIDVKVSRRMSLRFSPGLYLTQFGNDQTQKNFRFSIGPVFHFGGES